MLLLIFFAFLCLADAYRKYSPTTEVWPESTSERDISSTTDRFYGNKRDVSTTTEINDSSNRFNSSWTDLDKRPLPSWFDKAKIGIFLHWGLYSVPSYSREWFWSHWKEGYPIDKFMKANYPEGFTYQEFAPLFKAELFDPNAWTELFSKAGAKYVVLTSKDYDGFTLFPSKRSFGWNSVEVGPKRDLVGELATAVKNKNLKYGIYYPLYEWYNPMYIEDKSTGFNTRNFVETKVWPDMRQLVENYEPSVLWINGDWEAPDNYWKASKFLSWLYNDSPVKNEVVVNNRWGWDMFGKHGDYHSNDYRNDPDKFSKHKWENAFKMDKKCWGYRRNMLIEDVISIEKMLYKIVSSVSCGGNVLIGVGPTKEGTIDLIFQERLLTLGSWLSINGEAIYGSSPWSSQKDSLNRDTWYTCVKETQDPAHTTQSYNHNIRAIYAIVLKWPSNDELKIKDVSSLMKDGSYRIEILGNKGEYLPYHIDQGNVTVALPQRTSLKSEHAWTLKFIL